MLKILRNRSRKDVVSTLVLISGVVLILYPVVSTLENNYDQNTIVKKSWKANTQGNPVFERELKEAEAYNHGEKYGPILDPFLAHVIPDAKEYKKYLSNLNADPVMGIISIPKIDLSLPIYHGTTDDILDKGVGHLYGSSLPVGGKSTRAILTAHSGLSSATMFDNIRQLRNGDPIYLVVHTRKLKYEVTGTKTILPTETKDLRLVENEDTIVLITCTPYGINTHRLLVFAKRVPMDTKDEKLLQQPPTTTPWKTWMYFSLLLVVLAFIVYYILTRKNRKTSSKKKRFRHRKGSNRNSLRAEEIDESLMMSQAVASPSNEGQFPLRSRRRSGRMMHRRKGGRSSEK